jgi:hypothetical protein
VTTRQLSDPDGDRLVISNQEPAFDLDGAGPSDDRLIVTATDTLRYLGTRTAAAGETLHVYSEFTTPAHAGTPGTEGTLGNDVFRGTSAEDLFYFNTALGAGLGKDVIYDFGAGDRIVTTSPLPDDNNDGRIRLNSSDRLVFQAPAQDGPSSLKLFNQNGKAVSTLVLDQVVSVGDHLTWYSYRAAGDPVSWSDTWWF